MSLYTRIPIYANDTRRCVGAVKGDIFRKRFKFSTGALHRPPALAFDVVSLQQAEAAGASQVEVVDIETGKIYQAPIALVWSKGFPINRGYGDQIALRLREWRIEGQPAQLGLFGGAT
jgi:hypothetical protein